MYSTQLGIRYAVGFDEKNGYVENSLKHSKSQKKRSSICCLNNAENSRELLSSKVIYTVAAAMGHNKESHPECNSRVPAIVNALEKMGLTSEFRSTEIVELGEFKHARVEDIASVHESAYVMALEKVCHMGSSATSSCSIGNVPGFRTRTYFD